MKRVLKITLGLIRACLFAALLFGIYMLYQYHKSGFEVVLYKVSGSFKFAMTTTPQIYANGAEFFKSISALVLVIPLLVAYWIVTLIIGDTIRELNNKLVVERKVNRILDEDLIAKVRLDREIRERNAVIRVEPSVIASVTQETAQVVMDEPVKKSVTSVPPNRTKDASKTYVGAGVVGRRILDSKHSEAPDIFEEEEEHE